MGGKSTSHSAVLTDKRATSSLAFDLHSWQGLTEVLRVGKLSLSNAATYADFRNLVLEYAQRGGDIELRKKIDSIVSSFKKDSGNTSTPAQTQSVTQTPPARHSSTPASVEEEKVVPQAAPVPIKLEKSANTEQTVSTEQTRYDFGRQRNTPQFQSVATTQKQEAKETTQPPTPVIIQAEPKMERVIPITQQKEPENTKQIPPQEPPSPPRPSPTQTSSPAPFEFKSLDEYKARISEIKRLVHERIGNPATLINTHNDLGKKYMTALLTALKATGGGGTEGSDSAMIKLEEAFKELANDPEHKKEDSTPTPIPQTPAQVVEKQEQTESSKEVPMASQKVASTPTTQQRPMDIPVRSPQTSFEQVQKRELVEKSVIPTRPTTAPIPAPNLAPQNSRPTLPTKDVRPPQDTETRRPQNIPVRIAPESPINNIKKPGHFLSPANTLASLLKREHDDGEMEVTAPTKPVSHTVDRSAVPQPIPPESESQRTKFSHKGVARDTHENSEQDSRVDSTAVVVKQAELFSPAVSQALHQLLHEWSLFKSSGLLGIGPNGSEHPLYMKIATLSMGEVIAGRWEGADRKITKTIKEYVDAWRHEQGIAYTIQETFEHYLRRVVQRIQQRQKS